MAAPPPPVVTPVPSFFFSRPVLPVYPSIFYLEGPSPPGPINVTSWVGPGGPIYDENWPFLLLLDCFSAITIVVIAGFCFFQQVVLGPLRNLRTLFLGAPRA